MPRAPGTTPDWVTPGRCDYCPRPGDLAKCVCAGCGHTVGVNVCAEKHADFLDSGEYACRVCAEDLPEHQRHTCILFRKAAAGTGPRPTAAGIEALYQRVIDQNEAALQRKFAEEWAQIRPGEPVPAVRFVYQVDADELPRSGDA